jgi:hypothetical protein
MSTTYETFEGEAETDLYEEMETLIKKNPWAWQSVLAVLGLAGGVIAPILGATADVVTWFVHSQSVNSRLHVASIVSCALTIPLLMLGALCLDLLQRKTPNLSPPADTPPDESTAATTVRRAARQNAGHRLNRIGASAPWCWSFCSQLPRMPALRRRSSTCRRRTCLKRGRFISN